MTESEDTRYRLGRWAVREDWPVWILLVASFVAAGWLYPSMPEQMPVHWNIQGEVDGYGGRFSGLFGVPLINLGVYLLLLCAPLLDPKGRNYRRFGPTFRILRLLITVVMVFIWSLSLAAARGMGVRMELVVPATISVMFIILGNFMSRIKSNWFIGIRTPWTLSSEDVWRRTHRLGGWAFVTGGLTGLVSSFFPGLASAIIFTVAILGASLIPVVYSFVIWKQEQRRLNGSGNGSAASRESDT